MRGGRGHRADSDVKKGSCLCHCHLGWGPMRPLCPALRIMGLGMRGGLAVFMVGALLVLALLKAMVDSENSVGSSSRNPSTCLKIPTTKPTGNTPHGAFQPYK